MAGAGATRCPDPADAHDDYDYDGDGATTARGLDDLHDGNVTKERDDASGDYHDTGDAHHDGGDDRHGRRRTLSATARRCAVGPTRLLGAHLRRDDDLH